MPSKDPKTPSETRAHFKEISSADIPTIESTKPNEGMYNLEETEDAENDKVLTPEQNEEEMHSLEETKGAEDVEDPTPEQNEEETGGEEDDKDPSHDRNELRTLPIRRDRGQSHILY